MGERRDLRNLLKDTDFTQKRIIDDLAEGSDTDTNYSRRGVAGDIRRSEGGDFLKNIFIGLLLVGIVVGSFWISFLIGKKVLVPPIRNLPTYDIPVPAPKAVSKMEIEKAALIKEEPVFSEKEIKATDVKAGLPKPVAASKVTAAKKTAAAKPAVKKPAAKQKAANHYKVIVGANKSAAEADALIKSLKAKGFRSYVKMISGLYRIQAGAFESKEKANPLVVELKKKGFTPTVVVE
jgi:cell division septation protein DedD